MPANTFGHLFRITTFGESHGPAIGVVVDGCPAGVDISREEIQRELDRRRPGQSAIVTPRGEKDAVEILSGIFEGKTLGTPIAMLTYNRDADASAYETLKDVYRPGHADYTWHKKYGIRDWSGGGRASARETWARVAAGAIAKKIVNARGATTTAYVKQVGNIIADSAQMDLQRIEDTPVRCPDLEAAKKMIEHIERVRADGDSIGAVLEVVVTGAPIGLGEPVFDKLPADLAKAILSIPATKGIEFGEGFRAATMRGSEHNDAFTVTNGEARLATNHAGGFLGGISNGEPMLMRVALKPASSIAKTQTTADASGTERAIEIKGRHDPCLAPRAVPILEAMVNLVLADHLLRMATARIDS